MLAFDTASLVKAKARLVKEYLLHLIRSHTMFVSQLVDNFGQPYKLVDVHPHHPDAILS